MVVDVVAIVVAMIRQVNGGVVRERERERVVSNNRSNAVVGGMDLDDNDDDSNERNVMNVIVP